MLVLKCGGDVREVQVQYSLPVENSADPSVQRTRLIGGLPRGRFTSRRIHSRILNVHLSSVLLIIGQPIDVLP
ncbi:unnamed protein product [Strongylus vulgaris]|uniref:Uncharacterized protein n=1 Tax=Strongylus vulgaris TaxID=40348 RepID=A0A3P7JT71_STRVU|nr:unnamed protein product [Strongylus vulgaris]